MSFGFPWSESFIHDLSEKEFRAEFVADQMRTRIALLIRALREQPDRGWSQTRLAQELGKPQSVVSRLEDPDYGKMSLQTLLDVAAAYGLPLWIDIPEWEDWATLIEDVPNSKTSRRSFNEKELCNASITRSRMTLYQVSERVCNVDDYRNKPIANTIGDGGRLADKTSLVAAS